MQSFNSYSNVSNMDFKISCLSIFKILRNSSTGRTSKIRSYILFRNVSLHNSENLCIRFVIVIQYEESLLYTLDTISCSSISISISETFRFFFTVVLVSGLSCRKFDSYHFLILMMVGLRSHWNHPCLSFLFHPFHVTFIL